jgi:hypothetical protein
MALISAFIVSVLLIHDWELNQHFFVFLMLANGLGAFTSLYDGYWRFSNSIVFLTWTRFVGLAAPSILTLCLIAIGRTEIQFLLLGQLLVTFLNLQIILRFKQTNPASQFPDSNVILKSATRGFPTYLAEYLVTWTVPYLILRVEGSEVLGWYVVALSYALLADVTYGAIEAKNYKRMISNSMDGRIPKFWIFLRNSLPILGMHLFFLPLVVLIPIIYGQDFKNSSLFAIVILVVRVPMVIARAITSYLVSISRNLETFLIFVSFLITYIPVMLLSNFDLFSFHWIFAYSVAGTTMLGCAFLFLAKIKAIEIDK